MAKKRKGAKDGTATSKAKKGRKKTAVKKAGRKRGPQASAGNDRVKPVAAAKAAPQPKTPEELTTFLRTIDAPSLHDDDIAATLSHLNSVVAFRRAVGQSDAASRRAVSGKCYEKAFGDDLVSIYQGTTKVDEMTEESALAAGIPRCGA